MSTELDMIQNKNINKNNAFKELQENFLKSALGQVIDNAVDIGLKSILPDLIEDEIINIKNSIFENGFSEGKKEAISTAVNFGKSAMGIITGQFENVEQIEMAVRKGGIIDSISDLLDFTIKKVNEKGIVDNTVSSLIKNGKNTILKTIGEKIEDTINTQVKSVKKLQSYCNKWNDYYKEKDFEKMESTYKNIEKYLKKTIPLENMIKEARKIENLHNLIKNNGNNFNITEDEKKLAEKLIKYP